MTKRPIGYYVHHHGDGHRQRALALAPHLDDRAVLLGTGLTARTGVVPMIELDDDRPTDGIGPTPPDVLHYAPIDHDGIRRRVAAIATWIAAARPALMIVDVSVEVAMLARLASVPTVYVRLAGRRDDLPHRQAFDGATALLAPFDVALDDPDTDPRVRDRTIFAPGLTPRPPQVRVDERLVVGVVGRGGSVVDGEGWAAAARAVPDRCWRVIGPCATPVTVPPNLEFVGWTDDPLAEIARAGIVVGAAGDGLVGAIAAARRPFLCIPEARPFDEQRTKADRLAALGAALVCGDWPRPADWPALLDRTAALDPAALARLDDPDGAARAGAALIAIADEPPRA